jgi:hypothetical protein
MMFYIFMKDGKWHGAIHDDEGVSPALPIINPEILPVFPKPHINGFIIPKNFRANEFFTWPGTFRTEYQLTAPPKAVGYQLIPPK